MIIDDLCGCCHRYIKTSGNATVDHLSKYLAVRLALEELRSKGESNQMNLDTASEKQYTIYIATAAGQFTVSTASHSPQPCLHLLRTHPVGLLLPVKFMAPAYSAAHQLLFGKSLVGRKGGIEIIWGKHSDGTNHDLAYAILFQLKLKREKYYFT